MVIKSRYIILVIAVVTSVGLFFLSEAILTHVWVSPNADFFQGLSGVLDAVMYSYIGVFSLLVVGSLIGIVIGWVKGKRELKMGAIFSLIFAILITVVLYIWS